VPETLRPRSPVDRGRPERWVPLCRVRRAGAGDPRWRIVITIIEPIDAAARGGSCLRAARRRGSDETTSEQDSS